MQKSVTFRIDDTKLHYLDRLASTMERDRSYVINEAVSQYLEIKQWHAERIREAVAGADAGEFASEGDVKAAFDAFKNLS